MVFAQVGQFSVAVDTLLIAVNILLLIIGMFIETGAALLILASILAAHSVI